MATFESVYYENEGFWRNGMVEDSANIQRLERTFAMLPSSISSLLDVGCGNGVFAKIVKSRNPNIKTTCVDRSAAALEFVQADEKMRCEATNLPFEDKQFDCLTCLEVIEHLSIPNFAMALREFTRVTRNTIILSVPYNERIDRNMDICPECYTRFNRDLHFRRFTLEKFSRLFSDLGFRLDTHEFPVPSTHYLGFRSYFALMRSLSGAPKTQNSFLSPICPLCGYTPPAKSNHDANSQPNRDAPIVIATQPETSKKSIKGFVKSLWPKKTSPGYWIVGRFVRT
jgi:SAM-dependent methyltransferase